MPLIVQAAPRSCSWMSLPSSGRLATEPDATAGRSRSWLPNLKLHRRMRARLVAVADELAEQVPQVLLAHDDDVAEVPARRMLVRT